MTTITDSDLKDLINNRFNDLDRKIDVYIARTDERFNTIDERFKSMGQRFDQVDRRIDDLNARLNTFSLGFLGIVGVLVTGLLGIAGKAVFFPSF